MTRPVSTALWIAFAVFIVYGTTIPFTFSSEPGWAVRKLARVPLDPLVAADTGRRVSIPDFAQNVLLFLPFGVIGAIRLGSQRRSRLTTLAAVGACGAALSFGIEALQLLTVDRISSVSDITANTLGTLGGVLVAQLAERLSGRTLEGLVPTRILEHRSSYPALVAGILLCVWAWQPFDATLDVGSLVPKIRALAHDGWQAGPHGGDWIASVLYMFFAWATANLFADMRLRRPALVAAVVGLFAAVALEASQIIIVSQTPSAADASVHAVAVVAGLVLWRVMRGVGPLTP